MIKIALAVAMTVVTHWGLCELVGERGRYLDWTLWMVLIVPASGMGWMFYDLCADIERGWNEE